MNAPQFSFEERLMACIDKVILAVKRGTYARIENMDSRTIPVAKDEYGSRTE